MKFKRVLAILLTLLMVLALTIPASAKEVEYVPYAGYEYNSDNKAVSAPVTYSFSRNVDYKDWGLEKPITEAQDIYYKNDVLYILDSSNGRIIELNSDLTLKNVRDSFTDKSGNPISFVGSKGFTLSEDGLLYVSDTENQRILVFDSSNKLIREIGKPDTSLVGNEFMFDVTKLLISNQDILYAVVGSVNDGAFALSLEGEFQYFFGRNTVVRTAEVLLNFFRKRFMTREQLLKIQNYTPTPIANFDIDENGFVYTISKRDITSNNVSSVSEVRKLNYEGTNIFTTHGISDKFGDLEWDRVGTNSLWTSFSDVEVDNLGFIFLLDSGRGRVFQYSSEGQLVGTFGGYGEQTGMFKTPNLIETIGDKVIVLDLNGTITEFKPTEYATYLRESFLLLDSNDYEKCIESWNKVLKLNTNSQYPYYGLGMAYEQIGEYKLAMDNFKLAETTEEYSDAFHEYRKQYINDNLLILAIIAIVIIAGAIFAIMILRKKIKAASTSAYSVLEGKYTFPFYTLMHPSDGFGQFKYRKNLPSFRVSAVIILIFFFVKVLQYFVTGYCFNTNTAEDYSIFGTLLGTVGIYILFVVGNWAVCSLFDGNGALKEIASVTAYGLIPYILSQFINTILSNFLTVDEGIALSIISIVGILWSAMIIFVGLSAVNQYYTGKTFGTILLTIVAMLVLALIAFLFFSLIQQVLYFITSIWEEYQLR